MAEDQKNNPAECEEPAQNIASESLGRKSDEVNSIASLSSFKLGLARNLISLKNHVSKVTLLMTVAAMVFVTFSIRAHILAMAPLGQGGRSPLAFFFFCDVLCSLLSCLFYLNESSSKLPVNSSDQVERSSARKRKILFLVLFVIGMGLQIWIDFHYIADVNLETSLNNNPIPYTVAMADSERYTYWHIGLIIASLVLCALEPFTQPFFGCLKIAFDEKKHLKVRLDQEMLKSYKPRFF
jgi:hypothetical protein